MMQDFGDHVLYLEGFDVSDILGNEPNKKAGSKEDNKGKNIKTLYNYIIDEETQNNYAPQYEVPNLLDDVREFELNVGEEAKKKAVYALTKKVEEDGKEKTKYYIKEGAVIGKTFSSDPDENGALTEDKKVEIIDKEAEKKKQENEKDDNDTSKSKKKDKNDSTSADPNTSEDENGPETKKKKFALGNYMRMMLRDTDDEVVENVEEFVEVGEGGTSANVNGDLSAQCEALIAALGIEVKKTAVDSTKDYWDKIVQYSNEFGLDPYLVRAMIQQESGANPTNDNGSAYGLMQWEYTANGTEIEVEDANGQKVKITGITKEALVASVDLQLRAGCAELKKNLIAFKSNLSATLVGYNFGIAGCLTTLNYHISSHTTNLNNLITTMTDEIKIYVESGDITWVTDDDRQKYRDARNAGDPQYIEHILQYYVKDE